MQNSINLEENLYISSIKKVAGGGFLIIFGNIYVKISGFARQFIIIRMLSPEQYGYFALGLSIMIITAGLGNMGLYQGSQRYIAYYNSLKDRDKVRSTIKGTLTIITISGSLLLVTLAIFAGKISNILRKPSFYEVLLIFCLAVPVFMYSQIFVSFFFGFGRPDIAVFLNDFLFGSLSVGFIFIGLLFNRKIEVAAYAFAIAIVIQLLVSLILYWKHISHRLEGAKLYQMTVRLLLFSLPLFFSGVSYLILNNTDTLMLGYFMPSEQVGFYNAAFLLMNFLAIFLNSFAVIFMPVFTGLIARKAEEEARKLYQVVTKWIFVLTIPLVITFFLFPSQVLTLLFPEPYGQAGRALAILAAAEFLHTTLGPNEQALIAYGATKLHFYSYSVAAVINIVLNAILIPRMGITGAAIATGISLVALNVSVSSLLYLRSKIHPFGKENMILLLLLIGACSGLYLPARSIVSHSKWLGLLFYPIFLTIGVSFMFIKRIRSEEDVIVLRACVEIIKKLNLKINQNN